MDKERKELLISPVWSEGNLKNIPLRPAPEVSQGALAIEVHVEHVPTGDYEYAGLLWYYDDKNFVAIRKGPHGEDGRILSLVRRKAGLGDGPGSAPKNVIYNEPGVDLRMVIAAGKAQGWYRAASTDPWQSLGEVELPGHGAAQVGFRTGNGETNPSWARFSKFRLLQLDR
jgi:beta-xylosidase